MNNPIDKIQKQHSPSGDMQAFAVAVPGMQDYDTITVDKNLLRQQIDFLAQWKSSCSAGRAKDYIEGILNLLGGIHDLGWPPGDEEEDTE